MSDSMVSDTAAQALALLERALELLDDAGLSLAAVHLEHVVTLVGERVHAG